MELVWVYGAGAMGMSMSWYICRTWTCEKSCWNVLISRELEKTGYYAAACMAEVVRLNIEDEQDRLMGTLGVNITWEVTWVHWVWILLYNIEWLALCVYRSQEHEAVQEANQDCSHKNN